MAEARGDVRIKVGRDNPGQVVVGAHNVVTQSIAPRLPQVDAADWEELRHALLTLESQVAAEVPAAEQEEASQRVAELAEASTREPPNVTAMSAVWSWFLHHAPGLMGAVATVVFHPVVGALVSAAGDALTEQFERELGRQPGC